MDTASLTFAIDSSQAKTAAADLDRLTVSGRRVDGMLGAVVRAAREFAGGFRSGAREAIREYSASMEGASRSSQRTAQSMRETTQAAREQTQTVNGLTGTVRRYAAIVASAFGVREMIRAADSWGDITSRLKIATSGADEYLYVQQELSRIADLTYTQYNSVADAFANSTRNLSQLGLVTRDQVKLQEALLAASIVSGANDEKRTRIMDAFNKSLAMGVLRGDEWNAIQVNGSRIVGLLAESLGKTELQVAQLARNGGISVDKLIKALIDGSQKVSKEVESMPVRIVDSVVRIQNAFQRYVGELDKTYGLSARITGALDWMAANFSSVAQAVTVLGVIAIPGLVRSMAALGRMMLLTNPIIAIAAAATAAISALVLFQNEIRLTTDGQATLGDLAVVVWQDIRVAAASAAEWMRSTWQGVLTAGKESAAGTEAGWVSAILGVARTFDTMRGAAVGVVAAVNAAFKNLFDWIEFGYARVLNGLAERTEQFLNPILERLNAAAERMGLAGVGSPLALARREESPVDYDPIGAAREAWRVAMQESPMEDYLRALLRRAQEVAARRLSGGGAEGGGGKSNVNVPPSAAELKARLDAEVAAIRRSLQQMTDAYSHAESILEARRSAGLLDEREYYEAKRAFIRLNSDAQVAALEAESVRIRAESVSAEDVIKNQSKIAENSARIAMARADAAAKLELLSLRETEATSAMTRALHEARQAAQDYLDTLRQERQRDLDGMGMGERFRERFRDRSRVDDQYQRQIDQLNANRELLQLEGKWTAEASQQYEARLAIIRDYHARALRLEEEAWEERVKRESDWSLGAAEGLNNYLDTIKNVYSQVSDVVQNAFGGMEDRLVAFVQKGKLDFRSLVDSIAADLLRIEIRRGFSAVASGSGFRVGMANLFGGADPVGYLISMLDPKSHRSGLDYVPRNNYLAMLHQGERVVTAEENRRGRGPTITIPTTINVGAGVSRTEFANALAVQQESTIAAIRKSIQSRGEFW